MMFDLGLDKRQDILNGLLWDSHLGLWHFLSKGGSHGANAQVETL